MLKPREKSLEKAPQCNFAALQYGFGSLSQRPAVLGRVAEFSDGSGVRKSLGNGLSTKVLGAVRLRWIKPQNWAEGHGKPYPAKSSSMVSAYQTTPRPYSRV